jgi:hypothetical protein
MRTWALTLFFTSTAFFGALCLFAICYEHAAAQTLPNQERVYIVPDPKFPKPNETTDLSIDDYSVGAVGATISWFVNGVEIQGTKNKRAIQVESGDLGTTKKVTASLTRPNASTLIAEYVLRPIYIDLILEADTYTPAFYKGRALPSTEASVRGIAVVHDGTKTSRSSYAYKWTLDGEVLSGGPVKGGYTMDVVVPRFGNGELNLSVFDEKGAQIGFVSKNIGALQPRILFYEYSPLRGLREKALNTQTATLRDSTTIYGEPFFLKTNSLTKDSASFVWKLNGRTQTGADQDNTILLKGKAGETAKINLAVTTIGDTLQYARSELGILFE